MLNLAAVGQCNYELRCWTLDPHALHGAETTDAIRIDTYMIGRYTFKIQKFTAH